MEAAPIRELRCSQRRAAVSAVSSVSSAAVSPRAAPFPLLRIREYRKETDIEQVQELERSCADYIPNPNPNPNPNLNPSFSPASNNPNPNPNPSFSPTSNLVISSSCPNPSFNPNPSDSLFLLATSPLGDPLARVCTYPRFCMMVAEVASYSQDHNQSTIVGIVRAGLKEVIRNDHDCCENHSFAVSVKNDSYITMAYISGLRVAHGYRRVGVAQRLMREIEAWCEMRGAEYSYLATENENEASVNLFTRKLNYRKFRTPSILVQPLTYKQAKDMACCGARVRVRVRVVKISAREAEALYRGEMGGKEFFPRDIDAILGSPLNAGTWLAFCRSSTRKDHGDHKSKKQKKQGSDGDDDDDDVLGLLRSHGSFTRSWAMLSLWRYDKLIRFEMKASSKSRRPANPEPPGGPDHAPGGSGSGSGLGSGSGPGPDGFGVQLIYGVHVAGPERDRKALLDRLWREAHDAAVSEGSRALVVETGGQDPIRSSLPHLSEHHDLWCLKRLGPSPTTLVDEDHWTSSPPPRSFFLDPRDF